MTLIVTLAMMRFGACVMAEDSVPAHRGTTRFDQQVACQFHSHPVSLQLTGVALYRRLYCDIYAVGSYVEEGFQFQTAEQLAAADVPKRLAMVAERSLSGRLIAAAIDKEIRAKCPGATIPAEVDELLDSIAEQRFQAGDELRLTYLPGVGVCGEIPGKAPMMVRNLEVAAAIWDSYLGANCFNSQIKSQLVSETLTHLAATP